MSRSTRVHRRIRAPRAAVYRLLIDPDAIAKWKVPDGMTATIHTFEAREGGAVRVSLMYDVPAGTGMGSSSSLTVGACSSGQT